MARIKERTYLLFLYGNFDDEEQIKRMLATLLPVMSSDSVKYIWGENDAVCMFSSKVKFGELSDFVFAHISGECVQYFLTEKTDKLSVYGPDKVMEHLLSSEDFIPSLNDEITDDKIYDMIKNHGFKEFDVNKLLMDLTNFQESNEDDDEIKKIKTRFKIKAQEPSLDDILEKIQIEGINALTSQDKKILDDYSNGK